MGWACGAYGWEEGVYRVLVGKPEGKRPLGRPRRRWVDNIRMDLQEVGCGYMDWIGLAQDRERWRTLVIAVMNLRVPWNSGNFLTSCKPVSFSRRTLHRGVSEWVHRWLRKNNLFCKFSDEKILIKAKWTHTHTRVCVYIYMYVYKSRCLNQQCRMFRCNTLLWHG
jgi:hypothetical protein